MGSLLFALSVLEDKQLLWKNQEVSRSVLLVQVGLLCRSYLDHQNENKLSWAINYDIGTRMGQSAGLKGKDPAATGLMPLESGLMPL